MKPEIILQADMLDILFENRNKEYGAYLLRKGYNGRLLRSLSGTAFMVAAAAVLYISLGGHDAAMQTRMITIPDYVLAPDPVVPKKPEPVRPKAAPRPPVATIQNTTPVIVQEDVKIPPPTIDQLDGPVAIGSKTTDGAPGEAPAPAVASTGNGEVKPETSPVEEDGPVRIAEVMPEFPGGVKALQRFLQKNLMVPEGSVEPGQQLRIPVTFVVNKNGELDGLQFRDSVAEPVKREIRRVMNRMPKWKPGSQGGRPVAVYFTLPIIFAVESD